MTLIPTSVNKFGQDLNYRKRERSPSPDYHYYADDPHSSNVGSWEDFATDVYSINKDLNVADFASLKDTIPISSADSSKIAAHRHTDSGRAQAELFSPPSPKSGSSSPEPRSSDLNRLASAPPMGADSGSAGASLSRQPSLSFAPTDGWQEGVVVNSHSELSVTGPSSPALDSHGSAPSQNVMAPALESASPSQYDPALEQHQPQDATYAPVHDTVPATQHDEEAGHEYHNGAAPLITAEKISCRIWLCDIVDEIPVPRQRCNAVLKRDEHALKVHFGDHQARKELNFNMNDCPFIGLKHRCTSRKLEKVLLGVFVRHVISSQHFPDAPRIQCPTCDKSYERQDALDRHQEKCPKVPVPTEQASCSTQVSKKPRHH